MAEERDFSPRAMSRRGLVIGLLLVPLYVAVSHFSGGGTARAVMVFSGMLIVALDAFWYLRRQPWFWLAVGAIVVAHVALIATVHWTNRDIPAPALWPIGIADFAAICGFIKLVEYAMRPRRKDGTSA